MEGLALAFQFLTRLPVKREIDFSRENIGKAIGFFPLVGLVIGFLSWLVYELLDFFPSSLRAFFCLLSWIALTGGLHLDGLADSFDGFLSYRDKDQVLEIMKDSNIGAFGVLGLILSLGLKYLLILNLGDRLLLALLVSLASARLFVAAAIKLGRPAKDEGLAYLFSQSAKKSYLILGAIIYFGLVAYLDWTYLIGPLLNLVLAIYITGLAERKIGGYSGDVYGLLIELGEIVCLIGIVGVAGCV